MTAEEIEILVQANIEQAVKEFKKLLPEVKKQVKLIQTEINNANIKDIVAKVDVKEIKKQAQDVKKKVKEAFDPNDLSGLKINMNEIGKETQKAKSYLEEYHKEMQKQPDNFKNYQFHGQNNQQTTNKNETVDIKPSTDSITFWDTLRAKIQSIRPVIEKYKNAINGGGNSKQLELIKYQISEIEEKLEKAKNGEIKLSTKEIIQAEAELETLNNKKKKIENDGNKNMFSGLISNIRKITPQLNGISSITVKIKNQIKQWSTGVKSGLGHILKYAGALFGLRSIYNILRNSASSWLSSQNAGAQQLSANIEYMKYAMRFCFCSSDRIRYKSSISTNESNSVCCICF